MKLFLITTNETRTRLYCRNADGKSVFVYHDYQTNVLSSFKSFDIDKRDYEITDTHISKCDIEIKLTRLASVCSDSNKNA